MNRLVVLSGHSGAGKSTLAWKLVEEIPQPAVVITQDFFLGKFQPGEDTTAFFIDLANLCGARGMSVVMDGVNMDAFDELRFCRDCAQFFSEIEYLRLTTPLEECIRRDALRPYPVGTEGIRSQGVQ